jgi:signal transduction histidine kinase
MADLAEEQAALRRIATLVAQQASPDEVFAAATAELRRVQGLRDVRIARFEAATGRPTVATGGTDPAVAIPIVVHGRLWGAMVVTRFDAEPFPADIEPRVAQFTELVAIAIANAEARAEARRLADEQAALRRVATLVAQGAAPDAVFDAVIAEVGQLLGAAQVGLARYQSEQEIAVLAMLGADPSLLRVGMRLPLQGDSVSTRVRRTGRSARLDSYDEGTSIGQVLDRHDVNVSLGAPIVVDGALWGMIAASWKGQDRPPDDAEERLAEFAELVDTAIANADSRDQLTASRTRMLSAQDEARRRVVRDLHDGAQQRLVHTIITLKLAQRALREQPVGAEALVAEALAHAEQGNAELRELARGILPAVLTRGGLRAGVETVVARMDLPVEVDVTERRLAPAIEASAYFVVAEALTNAVKHSRATNAQVTARVEDGALRVQIRDNGAGGADPDGRGLTGIGDRVAAFGGTLRIDSTPAGGTVLTAEFPLGS